MLYLSLFMNKGLFNPSPAPDIAVASPPAPPCVCDDAHLADGPTHSQENCSTAPSMSVESCTFSPTVPSSRLIEQAQTPFDRSRSVNLTPRGPFLSIMNHGISPRKFPRNVPVYRQFCMGDAKSVTNLTACTTTSTGPVTHTCTSLSPRPKCHLTSSHAAMPMTCEL